eukprot:10775-Alexandrium_andersonii.AAC.1
MSSAFLTAVVARSIVGEGPGANEVGASAKGKVATAIEISTIHASPPYGLEHESGNNNVDPLDTLSV